MSESTVRENVFDEDECRVLARFLNTTYKTVEAVGYLAWVKVNSAASVRPPIAEMLAAVAQPTESGDQA